MDCCQLLITAMIGKFVNKRYRQEHPNYIKTYLLCFPVNPITLTCFYSLLTLFFYFTIIHIFSQFSLCAKSLLILGMLEVSLKIACLYMMAVGLIRNRSYLLAPQVVIYYALSIASFITCIVALSFYILGCEGLMTSLFCKRVISGCESFTSVLGTFFGIFFFNHAGKVLCKIYFSMLDSEDARFDVDTVVICFKGKEEALPQDPVPV